MELLLDAAEQLMLDEGYAAVTSRRGRQGRSSLNWCTTTSAPWTICSRRSFRRRAEQGLVAQQFALQSEQPLWNLWRFNTDPAGTRLTMEISLANHRKALRTEIATYAELFREQETKAFMAALERYGVTEDDVPPVVWAVSATSLSRVLVMEQEIDVGRP